MTKAFEPFETLGYALKQAQHAMRLSLDRQMEEIGLNAPQYAVLVHLEVEPGASNARLARRAFVTPQSMQAMLVKMERAGLIHRTPDDTHGRVQRTLLTTEGQGLLRRAHAIVVDADEFSNEAIKPYDHREITAALLYLAERMREKSSIP